MGSECLPPWSGAALDWWDGGAPSAGEGYDLFAFGLRFEWRPDHLLPGFPILLQDDFSDEEGLFRYMNFDDDGASGGDALVVAWSLDEGDGEDDEIGLTVRLGERWCTVQPTASLSTLLGLGAHVHVCISVCVRS